MLARALRSESSACLQHDTSTRIWVSANTTTIVMTIAITRAIDYWRQVE
jgi:hypothetical protein